MIALTPLMWVISVVAALFIGMSKTGVHGLGNLVVLMMAFVFGGMPSSGIVLPMLIMADVIGVLYYRRSTHWKSLLAILPWALVGIIIGLVVGKNISASQFRQLMGWLVIIGIVILIWNTYVKKNSSKTGGKARKFTFLMGVAGGFSTMIGNAAGPVMSIYLLSKKLPKNDYIGTTAWFFLIINLSKLPLQVWGWHNITAQTWMFNMLLFPAIALGAFLGIRIVKLIPEKYYRMFIIATTGISAFVLIFI